MADARGYISDKSEIGQDKEGPIKPHSIKTIKNVLNFFALNFLFALNYLFACFFSNIPNKYPNIFEAAENCRMNI